MGRWVSMGTEEQRHADVSCSGTACRVWLCCCCCSSSFKWPSSLPAVLRSLGLAAALTAAGLAAAGLGWGARYPTRHFTSMNSALTQAWYLQAVAQGITQEEGPENGVNGCIMDTE